MITGSEGQINETTYTCPLPPSYNVIYAWTGTTTTDACVAKDSNIQTTLYILSTDTLSNNTVIYVDNLGTNVTTPMYMLINTTLYHVNSVGTIYDNTPNYHCV
jgi:hypothetical protein